LANKGVDSQREQERAEWVALLRPRGGRDRNGVVFIDKVAVVGVAPLRPSSKFGEMLSYLSENSLPIQSLEGIFEINL
jgi:hypothetical protein